MINKERTIALSTVVIAAATVLFASGPLVATHQAQAAFCGFGCDTNPTTGDPRPGPSDGGFEPPLSGPEVGNPHNSQSCSGNPHGEVGSDTCNGST